MRCINFASMILTLFFTFYLLGCLGLWIWYPGMESHVFSATNWACLTLELCIQIHGCVSIDHSLQRGMFPKKTILEPSDLIIHKACLERRSKRTPSKTRRFPELGCCCLVGCALSNHKKVKYVIYQIIKYPKNWW